MGTYYGTRGTIDGLLLDGKPFDFARRAEALASPLGGQDAQNLLLPHVVRAHRDIGEAHVFEDIMQLVDWVRDDRPSPVTAEIGNVRRRSLTSFCRKATTSAESLTASILLSAMSWGRRASAELYFFSSLRTCW